MRAPDLLALAAQHGLQVYEKPGFGALQLLEKRMALWLLVTIDGEDLKNLCGIAVNADRAVTKVNSGSGSALYRRVVQTYVEKYGMSGEENTDDHFDAAKIIGAIHDLLGEHVNLHPGEYSDARP